MLLETLEPSLPFRTHRAIYSSTPTFIERSNVSGSYGDNQQDFFLTASQADWSLGEDQRFFRQADVDSIRRYWKGNAVDISIPGQVTILPGVKTVSWAASATGSTVGPVQFNRLGTVRLAFADGGNIYEIDDSGTLTWKTAHGLDSNKGGIASDGQYLYIAYNPSVTASQVVKWNNSYTSSAFSAATSYSSSSLVFADGTLYGDANSGVAGSSGVESLIRYDTSGSPTLQFPWKTASGDGYQFVSANTLLPYAANLLIVRSPTDAQDRGEIQLYDGNGVKTVAQLPPNFRPNVQGTLNAYSACIVDGILFVAGLLLRGGGTTGKTAIYYYVNGNLGLLFVSPSWATLGTFTSSYVAPFAEGIAFFDPIDATTRLYRIDTGGVATLFQSPSLSNSLAFAAGVASLVVGTSNGGAGNATQFYPDTTIASSATVTSSLFDFDNTLTKQFRSVKVDWASFSGDTGATVDISYQLDGVDGSYTNLQTGAVSGTEYTLPANTTGRAISVKITLNKGSSTSGPILKRVYVRAAPQLQSYRNREYILDLSGIGYKDQVRLADGTLHTLTGHEQAENLVAAIAKSSVSVSDRFCNLQTSLGGSTTTDSFTAILEPSQCEIYDIREGWDNPQEPGGFAAKISVREI